MLALIALTFYNISEKVNSQTETKKTNFILLFIYILIVKFIFLKVNFLYEGLDLRFFSLIDR